MMPKTDIYVELTDEQRQSIAGSMPDPWLAGQLPDIERIIAGKATPLEIIELINTTFRVGCIKGMSSVIEKHNQDALDRSARLKERIEENLNR